MRRFPPAAALLLLRRSLAAAASAELRSGPRRLVRASFLDESPSIYTSPAMAVQYHQCSSSEDRDDDEVLAAFNRDCCTDSDGGVMDGSACTAYVEKLCRSGNFSVAVRILRHLHDKNIHVGLNTFNMLLEQTGEVNFILFAKVFRYLLLSKIAPDLTSYKNVAKALQTLDEYELILKFVRQTLEITHDRDPTVMNCIIFAMAKYGHIDKSLIIFKELKKDQRGLDVVTFNTILDMLGKAGRVDQMLHEMTLMDELGHSPDIITYNTVINCLRRLGRLDQCKIFAREMIERGINPDLRTYTALIDIFGRTGDITEALEMFDQMKRSYQPSIYVYRALISNLRKAGQFELAEKLSEEMKSSASELLGPEDFKRKFKGRKINKNKRDNRK
ncbi:pentatricopeptide repeat-containing protein At1g11900 [Oryza brachyantha]|uniref:pentatricopeptide repeat-containing protein At1g11900 n=1 Tax=Oryza brachyantha TaxID=4533 RepID=UPI001ADC4245|nr:pentatricopeptide repeat-containing protein At1g11900 [Oryza brachyantha]